MIVRSHLLPLLLLMPVLLMAQVRGQAEDRPEECDCPSYSVVDHWCRAAELFIGTVTAADTVFKRTEVDPIQRKSIDHITVGFLVEHQWKGDEAPMKNIHTATRNEATDVSHCGVNFRVGEKYLVFAQNKNGQLTSGQCSGTRTADTVGRQFSDSLDYLMNGGTYEIAGVDVPQNCP